MCAVSIGLPASKAPSLRLVPRPIELAEAIGVVIRSWSIGECSIYVNLVDEDARGPLENCRWQEIRYDAADWWPKGPDRDCRDFGD